MNSYKKIAFIGLDGVPYSMLNKLFELGVMPRFKEIADEGTLLKMETSQPPVSSVAWTSFMTGANPAEHGIFGFTDVEKDRVALKLPSFDDVSSPTLWSKHPDKKSLIINLPFTYPARPLNGKLICGFVAPIFERAVYPDNLIPWLKSHNYSIDTDNVRARSDRNFLISNLFDNLNCLQQVSSTLMRENWDMAIIVVTGTDRLHHFLFEAFDDENHPHHPDFINYYKRLDAFISEMASLIDHQTLKVFLSDHGFTSLKVQVYLNNILKTLGYLNFTKQDPRFIDDLDPESLAFAMDPTRIYINSQTRFGASRMPQSRVFETVMRLKRDLESLKLGDFGLDSADFPGENNDRLFAEIKLRDEIYSGKHINMAPDLVVIPRRTIDVKATVNSRNVVSKDIFTGMHTHDDAFLLIGDPDWAARVSKPHIEQVAALLPWTSNLIPDLG